MKSKQGKTGERVKASGHIMKDIAGEERRKNEHSQMEIGCWQEKKKKEKHT